MVNSPRIQTGHEPTNLHWWLGWDEARWLAILEGKTTQMFFHDTKNSKDSGQTTLGTGNRCSSRWSSYVFGIRIYGVPLTCDCLTSKRMEVRCMTLTPQTVLGQQKYRTSKHSIPKSGWICIEKKKNPPNSKAHHQNGDLLHLKGRSPDCFGKWGYLQWVFPW